MEDLQATFEQAVEQHQGGHLSRAIELYRHVLEAHPEHTDTCYLLGTALLQAGEFDECVRCLERVVKESPQIPDARNNLGIAYQALGNWEQAAKLYEATIRSHPEYEQAYYNLGALMLERGLDTDAEKCFRRGLELDPSDLQTRFSLGESLKNQERYAEAELCFRDVIAAGRDDVPVYLSLAYVLVKQEQLEEATRLYEQIVSVQPEFYQVHNNLSYAYERSGKLERAIAAAERAVAIEPAYAEGYNNLGTALRAAHRIDEAIAAFQHALELQPDFPLARYNLGSTYLLAGDYLQGWPGYEFREATLDQPPRKFDKPRWDGAPIPNQRLLVHTDQGFGDTLEFSRFLPLLKERSQAELIFECQPALWPLFAEDPAVTELLSEGDSIPAHDRQISLVSLPGLFEIEQSTIPTPTLVNRTSLTKAAAAALAELPADRKRIGIVWQGNPRQARDVVRSCPADRFGQLARQHSASFVSLQVGEHSDESVRWLCRQPNIHDFGRFLTDFGVTSALMTELDLVITVDTSTAHLAGSLGLPVWTLLCHTPDWRWHLDRDDCPWYPTMRLLRQPSWGDWSNVFRELDAALSEFLNA